MEIDVSETTNHCANGTGSDNSSLRPVPPCASGEGFPYAPVDWPNPGDIWKWKVGNKINPYGCYTHRFLLVPKRLQKSPTRKIWLGSKPSIKRFLQSEFPDTDIDAFLASFTWEIPGERSLMKKAKKAPPSQKATPKNEAEWGTQTFRRTRNSLKRRLHVSTKDTTTSAEVHILEEVSADKMNTVTADQLNTDSSPDENDLASALNVIVCPTQTPASESAVGSKPQDTGSLADHLAQMTPEDFDIYLNSLDEIISPSLSRAPNPGPMVLQNVDFTKPREELSSLLAMGFPSLIASNKLPELINLSSELQSDPHVSLRELSMLNRIQEIPLASQHFLEAKHVTEVARKFFMELEAKIAQISALKSEYMSSKDKIALLQAEDASASSTIKELDEQIAALKSRRATLTKVVKMNKRKIAELTSTQKRAFDSIPKIVDEVKVANSERSQWELKQKEAAKQEAEILAKFAPLEGFSFRR
ncbi:hypothetical protein CDL12_23626 [Handroanthus impetiginosus]|uniref:DUF7081 domain-containing protein n=1 Tax=Handroanthus impetiginosus TaxID=429701 RepID=A0A2G9GEZ9_9LAMI|nr:hypothetical protein CDL12_23626 [Handroanthus impetiginosus]